MKSQSAIQKITPMFQKYIDILNVIESKMDSSNIAYISQGEIGKQVSLSPTNISQRLKQLIKFGAIEQCSPAVYKLLNNDLWHTPYKMVHEVSLLVSKNPELIGDYKVQAELLNVQITDIFQAWGYLNSMDDA